ncbi:MAG: undecaprenyl/decaprenyl-phosphate alpha-N-acetylglucosaminyl 1-phosphate transferase [Ignavibacteriales bacterium]|nr:undecaprenyl/decaprenyl-phosphate alpha-N-acetylglucosaminyl 1-phosphate transferase [Ignavibacteriales bacterium]
MVYVIIFYVSLSATILFTPFLIDFLRRSGIVNNPNERGVSEKIIPQMGGVIIITIILIMISIFYYDLNSIRYIIISSLVITICGVYDDLIGLHWLLKFFFQFLVATLLMLYLVPLFKEMEFLGFTIPEPYDKILLFVFIVGAINSINLMDGLDGLVTSYSILNFSVVLLLAFIYQDKFLILTLISLLGILFGFLKFNAYPARIFLGDTGSLVLGFFLVLTLLKISIIVDKKLLELTFPLVILLIPIVDTIKVMLLRIARGRNPFLPDKTHLHHKILETGLKHNTTVFVIQTLTVISIILILLVLNSEGNYLCIIFPLIIIIISFKQIILFFKFCIKKIRKNTQFFYSVGEKLFEYRRILLFISTLAVLGILLFTLPERKILNFDRLFLLMSLEGVLFFVAVVNYFKYKKLQHIYIFFNICLFFILYNFEESSLKSDNYFEIISDNLFFTLSIILLVITVILMSLIKRKIEANGIQLFTSVDMTIFLLIFLLFFIKMFLISPELLIVVFGITVAFIFYMWYKFIILLYRSVEKLLFFFSFALPNFLLLYYIFN